MEAALPQRDYLQEFQERQAARRGVVQAAQAANLPINGRTSRRILVNYGTHLVVTMLGVGSFGVGFLIGMIFDLFFRLPVTLLGPIFLGDEHVLVKLFGITFFAGNLLDKADALWVGFEVLLGVIAIPLMILGIIPILAVSNPLLTAGVIGTAIVNYLTGN